MRAVLFSVVSLMLSVSTVSFAKPLVCEGHVVDGRANNKDTVRIEDVTYLPAQVHVSRWQCENEGATYYLRLSALGKDFVWLEKCVHGFIRVNSNLACR